MNFNPKAENIRLLQAQFLIAQFRWPEAEEILQKLERPQELKLLEKMSSEAPKSILTLYKKRESLLPRDVHLLFLENALQRFPSLQHRLLFYYFPKIHCRVRHPMNA